MFAEYEKIMRKIIEEEPSTLTVYLDLDNVKACAKVSSNLCLFMVKYLCGSNSDMTKQSLLVRTVVLMKRMIM